MCVAVFAPPELTGSDSIDAQVVLHAMPGVVMHTFGDRWVDVYLPALAPYFVSGADLETAPRVRLPEGPRGRLSRLETRLGCVRSPGAVLPCEGPALDREPRSMEFADRLGHVWLAQIGGGRPYCVRCRTVGGIRPLSAEPAPSPWSTLQPWQQPYADLPPALFGINRPERLTADLEARAFGRVTCSLGDETTRSKLREGTLGYLSGGFGRQIYTTTPRQRLAIFERASNPFDVGGRWELADDVTPETALECEPWIDLAGLVLESVATLLHGSTPNEFSCALAVWRGWLDGTEEAPPRSHWDPVYSDLMLRLLAPRLQSPGVVYLDTRKLLTALLRTDIGGRIRMSHPAEELVRDLRSMHDKVRERDCRASVMVLFPSDSEAAKSTGLTVARRVWASGR